jgi:predicted DNA-binding protein (MmcQ/YjbR family)
VSIVPTEKQILTRLRPICLALPEANEIETWGHPTFRAGTKTFAVLETYQGKLSIACKCAPRDAHALLEDARFYVTPYAGKHGWLSLQVGSRVDWDEVREFVVGSYRLVALKRMLAALDGAAAPARRAATRSTPNTTPRKRR